MFSASQQVAETHESNQNARIEAGSTASDTRLTALETKTKHLTLENEGTSDEHHGHTRRTQATDRITVDSTAASGTATLEAIAHANQNAILSLQRGNATTKLIHGSPAVEFTTLVVNATGGSLSDQEVFKVNHGSGELSLGSGVSTISNRTNVLEIVPTSGDAALTVKGTASTSNCTLRLLEGQTNTGFQIVANGGEDGLNFIREDDGSTDTLLALKSDGQRIQQYFSDDAVEHNRVGAGNLTHLSKVTTSSNTVSDQIRIGTGSTEGYNTVASNTSFAIQRVNASTATDALSITRSNGEVTTQGFTCVGSTTVGGGLAVGGAATVTGNLTVTGATSLASTTASAITVSSSTPTLALVDTNNNSDFRIFLENGHVRFQDTTNNDRDFLVANSSGDCNVGVSGQTTAIMGKIDVNGDSQVRRVFCRQTSNSKIEFVAGATVGGAFTAPIRLFDNANSTIRIGGVGASSLVECQSLTQTSDRTLKEDIRPIENAARLLQVEPVSWLWKRAEGEADDTQRHRTSGVIAQDVEAVCPEAVRTNADGIKTIEYRCLTALLIAHVKELTARVAALEAA